MASAAVKRELEDVTECPICCISFTDPRSLPCIHTFCCRCIRDWCKDKKNGEKATCPLCRKDFAIPQGGVEEMPKNFFVTKLLSIRDLAAANLAEPLCDMCSSDESVSTDKTATVFCMECQQKLCAACHVSHSKFKQLKSHKTMSVRGTLTEDELCSRYPPPYCEKHRDKVVELYCFDCKAVSCMMCFVEIHASHRCADVSQVSDEFRRETATYIGSIEERLDRNREKLRSLEDDKKHFTHKVEDVEAKVRCQAQHLHACIERHKRALLDELSEIRRQREKEIDEIHGAVEQHSSMMVSFENYLKQMDRKGSACDVARESGNLKSRFTELLADEVDKIDNSVARLGTIDVSFASADSFVSTNIVGRVAVQISRPGDQSRTHALIHDIPCAGVRSMALYGGQLFAVGEEVGQLQVYDASTCCFQRRLSISGIKDSISGLAACENNKCLYVSDFIQDNVLKIDMTTDKTVLCWNVDGPRGLSVNRACNVLVACCGTNALLEYSTSGSLICEISLPGCKPAHGIELPSGLIAVGHFGTSLGVRLINDNDRVVKSYVVKSFGHRRGSSSGLIHCPRHLAVDKQGFILVAEFSNNRVVALDSTLTESRELPLSSDDRIERPLSLCLDESRGRLFVGTDSRLLVFDNVSGLAALFRK